MQVTATALARDVGKAEVIDCEATDDLVELLEQMTGGKGPDVCAAAKGGRVGIIGAYLGQHLC